MQKRDADYPAPALQARDHVWTSPRNPLHFDTTEGGRVYLTGFGAKPLIMGMYNGTASVSDTF